MMGDDDMLPISIAGKKQSRRFNFTSSAPSVWTSLSSVAFMSYLLSRRHEVTPDFFHFVTCLQEDLQHMLWLVFLWLCFRQPTTNFQDAVLASIELVVSHCFFGTF
jgi:hypothetical protein